MEIAYMLVITSAFAMGSPKLKGVFPALLQYYIPTNHKFMCLDNSKTIPFSWVNDDYCDCNDGSDEPGTNACNNGLFYCVNAGHESQNISSTRVNDGVCDCCDGTDEYFGVIKCIDTCKQLNIAKIEELNKKASIKKIGLKKKIGYITEAAIKKSKAKINIETIKSTLLTLENELATVTQLKDVAEKAVKQTEHYKNDEYVAKMIFDSIDTNNNGKVTTLEITDYGKSIINKISEIQKDKEYSKKLTEGISFDYFQSEIYHKLYLTNQTNSADNTTDIAEDYDQDFSQDDTNENPSLDEINQRHGEITSNIGNAKSKLNELENLLRIDFGSQSEYLILYGKEIIFENNEYIYRLNMFKDVHQQSKSDQHSTCIGRWRGWKDNQFNAMEYAQGDSCWNGPTRSTIVYVKCGKEDNLISINEPTRCYYEMVLESPASCFIQDAVDNIQMGDGKDEL